MEKLDFQRELVERCIKGERSAQYNMYRMYSKGMYNICLRMLNNSMEAEDTLQESFIDVYKKLHTFKYESTPGAWIKRIVVNNCINKLRKRKLHIEDIDEGRYIPIEEQEVSDHSFEVNKIKKAILQLPDGYRAIFSLYAMEGYDHQEIGQIMNISESTSKSQYSRAKKKIRELISAY
ncbi:MAG: RNA polymerase sigma factor [Saprospiraceae bacterium]|nr:RNA polymerase sigma factor [Saprospiraceae bacterium]